MVSWPVPSDPILIPEQARPVPQRRAYGIAGVVHVSARLINIKEAVAIYSDLGGNLQRLLPLFIKEYEFVPALSEVRQGDLLRLITPALPDDPRRRRRRAYTTGGLSPLQSPSQRLGPVNRTGGSR